MIRKQSTTIMYNYVQNQTVILLRIYINFSYRNLIGNLVLN